MKKQRRRDRREVTLPARKLRSQLILCAPDPGVDVRFTAARVVLMLALMAAMVLRWTDSKDALMQIMSGEQIVENAKVLGVTGLIIAAAFVCMFGLELLSGRRERVLLTRWLAAHDAKSATGSDCRSMFAEAAQAEMIRQRLATRWLDRIDVESWRRALRQRGFDPPLGAALCEGRSWPTRGAATPLAEEIDPTEETRPARQERLLYVLVILISLVPAGVMAYLLMRTGVPPAIAWSIIALMLAPAALMAILWIVGTRRLAGILQLSAIIAAPQQVEVVQFGSTKVFTAADSMMFLRRRAPLLAALSPPRGAVWRWIGAHSPQWLHRMWRAAVTTYVRTGWLTRWRRIERWLGLGPFRWPVTVELVRSDGERWRRHFISGRGDPGLVELVARWTAELGRGQRVIASDAMPGPSSREERQ